MPRKSKTGLGQVKIMKWFVWNKNGFWKSRWKKLRQRLGVLLNCTETMLKGLHTCIYNVPEHSGVSY
jgi:hypothetical protein